MQSACTFLPLLQPRGTDARSRHLQVPEWTKCSNREKRKEKEKPFYSDSEGESGPTESADSGEQRDNASCHSEQAVMSCPCARLHVCDGACSTCV